MHLVTKEKGGYALLMVELSDIKGRRWIYSDGKYIVITGKELWILKKDLSVICCRKDISNVYKVAFPSDNIMLTGQGKKASYRLIRLDDGSEIYTWPPISMEHSMHQFALSLDRMMAFDCFDWRMKDYLVSINLQTGELDTVRSPKELRVTSDMLCDKEGALCILQSQYEEDGCTRVSNNGILSLPSNQVIDKGHCFLKYQWNHSGGRIAEYFLGDTGYILTNDLHVYDPETAESIYLLENEPSWKPTAYRPSGCWIDESRHLVFLMYTDTNVVIDWEAKKVVALYKGPFVKGCLIGNEYWISSGNGIRRLPFPMVEEA